MIDISGTIEPKSDQLNADDLIAGPVVLIITGVQVVSGDQPVLIDYEGGQGRPYKPCKSMRRALIHAWGKDGADYVGRKMVVYNDTSVRWGGSEVGGIRISHLSHIDSPLRIMLTVTRGKRQPYKIEPLIDNAGKISATPEELKSWIKKMSGCQTMAELSKLAKEIKARKYNDSSRSAILAHYQERVESIRNIKTETMDPDGLPRL